MTCPRKKNLFSILGKIILTAFLILFDQSAKVIALKKLHQSESIPVINNIFHLTLVYNTGSAFGFFRNQNLIFTYITIFAIVLILMIFVRRPKFQNQFYLKIWQLALGLIFSGAAGNLIDRIRLGYVVDFLDFRIWPVFNFADCMITGGVFLLILVFLSKEVIT